MPAPGPKGALFPTTYRAGAAVLPARFVKRGADADSVVHNAAETTPPLGITEEGQATVGKPVRVAHREGELVRIEAGAAFAIDVQLASDATGRAILRSAPGVSVTHHWGAISRQAAAVAGDLVLCEIRYGKITG
jgi:hypothetical protein